MEIKYMKLLEETKTRACFTNEPLTESEIQELERTYNNGNEFPKAYREFLYIAGKFSITGLNTGPIDYLQKGARKSLEQTGHKIDRPFLAFDQLDDCEQFSFFYLDEDTEDPKVYNCFPFYTKYGDPLVKANGFTFSELIDEAIRRTQNNIPF